MGIFEKVRNPMSCGFWGSWVEISQNSAICLLFACPPQPVLTFLAEVHFSPVKFLLRKCLKSKLIPQHPSLHVPSLALGIRALSRPSLKMTGVRFCGSGLEEEAQFQMGTTVVSALRGVTHLRSLPVRTGAYMLAEVRNNSTIEGRTVDLFIQQILIDGLF